VVEGGIVLTIRPSKMLARRLGIALTDRMPEARDRLADWCVRLGSP
jgi:hypothetical protein